MVASSAPILIFDGECGFCSASAQWIASKWPRESAVTLREWQSFTERELFEFGLTLSEVKEAAWWIDGDGKRYRGHLAVAKALKASRGWESKLGVLLLVPPFVQFGAIGYPLVVRWRGHIRLPKSFVVAKEKALNEKERMENER